MIQILVRKGTEVLAVNCNKNSSSSIEKKVIKKDTMYSLEDVKIDPIGEIGTHKRHKTIGGQFARGGYYGLQLPENTKGYEIMLVHKLDVYAG